MLTTILISVILIFVTIAWHYWSINLLYDCMPDNRDHSHFLRSVGVLILLFAVHIVEIFWFTGGLYLVNSLGHGGFSAEFEHTPLDYFYFSTVSYTTLGLSSFEATGYLKLLTGLEALTGFVMLTWSATFFYNLTGKHASDNQ